MSEDIRDIQDSMGRVRFHLSKGFEEMKSLMAMLDRATDQYRCKVAPDVTTIINTVSEFYRVPVAQVVGTPKYANVVRARQTAMYAICRLTPYSQREIADAFNRNDHTLVIYCRDRVKELMEMDKRYSEEVEMLVRTCSNLIQLKQAS
jgi:chromosomal replication initiation ATPase DnaA